MKTRTISDEKVQKFVGNLDIGDVNILEYPVSGVSRTVTALTTLMIDINLKCKNLHNQLVWFHDVPYHFVIQFSDDGAPESKDTTMTIGSLTMWNLGSRARSRDYQYILHAASLGEKDPTCELLWKQHTDEMMILEGNELNIAGEKCTIEFQPSADQSWQIWANNVLPASSTYPSPYVNVHKSDLVFLNGSIGEEKTNKWHPPTWEERIKEIKKVDAFKKTLNPNLAESTNHDKLLEFMADNGLRQLGHPRIGKFSDLQRPDPLHLEMNSWQHVLDAWRSI